MADLKMFCLIFRLCSFVETTQSNSTTKIVVVVVYDSIAFVSSASVTYHLYETFGKLNFNGCKNQDA